MVVIRNMLQSLMSSEHQKPAALNFFTIFTRRRDSYASRDLVIADIIVHIGQCLVLNITL